MCEDSVLIESVRRDRLEYMCLELQGARVALRGGWVGLKENECSLCSLPPKIFLQGFPPRLNLGEGSHPKHIQSGRE